MSANERDERMERLLGATRASANPAVLARARERLAARATAAEPAWLRFLGRPVALATACGLLAVSLVVSVAVLRSEQSLRTTAATTNTSLVAALLDDDGTYGVPSTTTSEAGASGAADDSNEVTR